MTSDPTPPPRATNKNNPLSWEISALGGDPTPQIPSSEIHDMFALLRHIWVILLHHPRRKGCTDKCSIVPESMKGKRRYARKRLTRDCCKRLSNPSNERPSQGPDRIPLSYQKRLRHCHRNCPSRNATQTHKPLQTHSSTFSGYLW